MWAYSVVFFPPLLYQYLSFFECIKNLTIKQFISQLAVDKVEKVEDAVKVGEKYNFYIQTIDEEKKKVSLSIKDYFRNQDRKDIEKYLGDSDNVKKVF